TAPSGVGTCALAELGRTDIPGADWRELASWVRCKARQGGCDAEVISTEQKFRFLRGFAKLQRAKMQLEWSPLAWPDAILSPPSGMATLWQRPSWTPYGSPFWCST